MVAAMPNLLSNSGVPDADGRVEVFHGYGGQRFAT
jgi:hypothetical protein